MIASAVNENGEHRVRLSRGDRFALGGLLLPILGGLFSVGWYMVSHLNQVETKIELLSQGQQAQAKEMSIILNDQGRRLQRIEDREDRSTK